MRKRLIHFVKNNKFLRKFLKHIFKKHPKFQDLLRKIYWKLLGLNTENKRVASKSISYLSSDAKYYFNMINEK